jgi:mannose-6-phosphate isomerase-like protein (cupin superfamily)
MEIIKKGWGYEKIIVNNNEYCGKILHFNNHKKCSYHMHILKLETFYLQFGKVLLKIGSTNNIEDSDEIVLNPGDKIDIPRGTRHQIIALEESELFEFSTQHFEEDSIRIIKGD